MSIKGQTMVKVRFEGKNLADCDFWTKSDPYLVLSRPKRGGGDFTKVRKTETIRNNLNPSWKILYIPLTELCDNDLSLPLRITVYDEDRNSHDDLIGEAEVTLQHLINYAVSNTAIILKIKSKKRGEIYVRECNIEDNSSTELVRKMSTTSYPERKASQVSISSQNGFHSQQHFHQESFQAPQQPQYQQQPQYFASQPQYPPQPYNNYQPLPQYYHQQPTIPEDPTDTRPASIWLQ